MNKGDNQFKTTFFHTQIPSAKRSRYSMCVCSLRGELNSVAVAAVVAVPAVPSMGWVGEKKEQLRVSGPEHGHFIEMRLHRSPSLEC